MKDKNGNTLTPGQNLLVNGRPAMLLEVADNITIGSPEGPKKIDLAQVALQAITRPPGPHFSHEAAGVVVPRNWIYTEIKEVTADAIEILALTPAVQAS
jgi:hypothetical protein